MKSPPPYLNVGVNVLTFSYNNSLCPVWDPNDRYYQEYYKSSI